TEKSIARRIPIITTFFRFVRVFEFISHRWKNIYFSSGPAVSKFALSIRFEYLLHTCSDIDQRLVIFLNRDKTHSRIFDFEDHINADAREKCERERMQPGVRLC